MRADGGILGLADAGRDGEAALEQGQKSVVDFIDLHFGSYVYPTFNVADSGICVGVGFYLWYSLREPK
jgi:signal peptidase II